MLMRLVLSFLIPTLVVKLQYAASISIITKEEFPPRIRKRVLIWGATGAILVSLAIQLPILQMEWPGLQDTAARMLLEGAFIAPLVEEIAKSFPLLLLLTSSTIRGRRAFLAAGMISGMGFFWTESLISLLGAPGLNAWLEQLTGRTIHRGLMHAFFSGLCGLGIGFASLTNRSIKKWCWVTIGIFVGTVTHLLNNFIGIAGMHGLGAQAVSAANQLFMVYLIIYLMLFGLAFRRKNSRRRAITVT